MDRDQRERGERALARARAPSVQEHEAAWDVDAMTSPGTHLAADVDGTKAHPVPRPGLGQVYRELVAIQFVG